MMNYIYLVKVFNIKEGIYVDRLEEETVAVCTDKDRAEEILEHNMYGIDDRCYDYGLIVTVVDGKVYGEISPIDLSIYEYNVFINSFELLDDKDKVSVTVKKNYSFLD